MYILMSESYKEKYIKYKNKYLNLIQNGGSYTEYELNLLIIEIEKFFKNAAFRSISPRAYQEFFTVQLNQFGDFSIGDFRELIELISAQNPNVEIIPEETLLLLNKFDDKLIIRDLYIENNKMKSSKKSSKSSRSVNKSEEERKKSEKDISDVRRERADKYKRDTNDKAVASDQSENIFDMLSDEEIREQRIIEEQINSQNQSMNQIQNNERLLEEQRLYNQRRLAEQRQSDKRQFEKQRQMDDLRIRQQNQSQGSNFDQIPINVNLDEQRILEQQFEQQKRQSEQRRQYDTYPNPNNRQIINNLAQLQSNQSLGNRYQIRYRGQSLADINGPPGHEEQMRIQEQIDRENARRSKNSKGRRY